MAKKALMPLLLPFPYGSSYDHGIEESAAIYGRHGAPKKSKLKSKD
jgi:hypothetical protein